MIIDFLLELKNNINEHGIRWGVFFTLVALYRKEKRNLKLDDRDEALFHNQKVLMDQMGVGDKWRGPPKKSRFEDLASLKKSFASLPKAISQGNQRRKRNMTRTNWITLIPALLGVLKLVLQPLGVDLSHVTDDQVNTVINGIAAAVAIWGVLKSHKKEANTNAQHIPGDGPAV